MITYAKVLSWRELGDMIVLECVADGQYFEVSTYKRRIDNVHLLNEQFYLRLNADGDILGIDLRN
ncbi:hypothetical protein BK742_09030 [Bacillus thuringiensis serovar pingluonsis]|uniref:DUF2283 domain-containing protein n=1 Tax=Bacillus thuringiensis serovar pingluonsis TaxID=180881 RepID=A0A243BIG9_BACTU|nr:MULTISPECIES: hypothetical protein [Bacillus cereus group]MEB9686076.1 hypothetical protein [Bacillus anthracis]OPD56241.1 hypothetical protein BVG01_25615 [Bacillus anthracis]OTY46726.1 hypothetical protein BK742_09030 [Bacillus thuringiensis serovar pingluonsis]